MDTIKEIMTNNNHIFDNNPDLLGFKNMVYDLKLGQFRPYKRSDMTTGYDWREPTAEEIG